MIEQISRPLVLYSTGTWLAYAIAERFYGGLHHVWCTPFFAPESTLAVNYKVPPSSSPFAIYRGLRDDVACGDQYSTKIEANKAGILNGAQVKLAAGAIGQREATDISLIVEKAQTCDFAPLIFIIPFDGVRDRIHEVPVEQRAHPLSVEFVIESLPRERFDIIYGV